MNSTGSLAKKNNHLNSESKKERIMLLTAMWIDLEIVMLSEGEGQTQNDFSYVGSRETK